jgi:hypothetical protein
MVGVDYSGEGGRLRRCRFNALVSAQEVRRRDEALVKNEAETVNSSWLHVKEALDNVATSARGKAAPERGKGGEMMLVRLT